jgi:hypothetical protein
LSTIVVLKENNVLILGTDSRFMKHDLSGIASDEVKIFEIAQQTFVAGSGWKYALDFELATARERAGKLATTDIRIIGEALRQEMIPYLRELVELSRSVVGLHTYGGSEVCGDCDIHASVLVGRDGRGDLGYSVTEYAIRDGVIVIKPSECFGRKRQIWARPGEPLVPLMQDPRIWADSPVEVVQRILTTLKAANPYIGGPDQIIKLDRDGVRWVCQLPASDAVSVPSVEAVNSGAFLVDQIPGLSHATINVGGGGMTFSGVGGVTVMNGGDIHCDPGSVYAHSVRCSPLAGAFWFGTEPGLYTTRVVKDGDGNNKTVYIKGGIIVGWDV